MLYGFNFNAVASSSLGVFMRSKNRQLLPATSDQYKEIPGMDGSHLFPDSLKDRYIDIDCSVRGASVLDLRSKARLIAAWLYTPARAKLIFDDEPGVFYWAKLTNQVDLQQMFVLGEFSLQFRCLPYAYSVSPVVVEEDFANGDSITITNLGTANTPVFIEITGLDISGYTAFPALGVGVCPDISLSELGQGITLTINGDECSYTGSITDDVVYIDTDRMTVQLNGSNALRYHDGTFPMLVPGDNAIVYSSPNGCGAKVKFTYYERWL
jgi:predicted phage tail component-like protein